MAEQEKVGSEVGKDHVLAHLLSPDETRSRNEPEIASNIGTQLQHMALSTWSISILRRLRDANPTDYIERPKCSQWVERARRLGGGS